MSPSILLGFGLNSNLVRFHRLFLGILCWAFVSKPEKILPTWISKEVPFGFSEFLQVSFWLGGFEEVAAGTFSFFFLWNFSRIFFCDSSRSTFRGFPKSSSRDSSENKIWNYISCSCLWLFSRESLWDCALQDWQKPLSRSENLQENLLQLLHESLMECTHKYVQGSLLWIHPWTF